MEFTFQLPQGDSQSIILSSQADGSYIAYINERSIAVTVLHQAGSGMLLQIGTWRGWVHTVSEGALQHIMFSGKSLTLEKISSQKARTGGIIQEGNLTATMPGQVMQILVTVGESVQAGQTLLLLEAMKMEMRVKAPSDGIVKQFFCNEGEAVERGQLLVEVEVSE